VRHCPECRRTYKSRLDLCPECWERLAPGGPRLGSALSLVFETGAFYEADMLETLLKNEGIPCLKIPGSGALLWPMAVTHALTRTRLYVRADMAPLATELIAEVTGGESHDS
jgi:hypothetical protein